MTKPILYIFAGATTPFSAGREFLKQVEFLGDLSPT
jgi:hypothetical protein